MQKRMLAGVKDEAQLVIQQIRGKALSKMIEVRAYCADLGIVSDMKPLARHRCKFPLDKNAVIPAKLDGAGTEWTRAGESCEGHHFNKMAAVERHGLLCGKCRLVGGVVNKLQTCDLVAKLPAGVRRHGTAAGIQGGAAGGKKFGQFREPVCMIGRKAHERGDLRIEIPCGRRTATQVRISAGERSKNGIIEKYG
jgi:hypothetical protein